MMMSLPSFKVPVFFVSLCLDIVSFRGRKIPGPRPYWSPFGFNLKFPKSISPLFIWESPPPSPNPRAHILLAKLAKLLERQEEFLTTLTVTQKILFS